MSAGVKVSPLHDSHTSDAAFDAAFTQRAPHLSIVPETDAHRSAMRDLFAACSPMGAMLPPALLDMQFEARDISFRNNRPSAMRRVVLAGPLPIARIIVDWQEPGASHGVDIAVHPDHRGSGAGLAMLRAWLAVADREGRACSLDVIADNPARIIYRRLGFVEEPCDPEAPYRLMRRACPSA